MKRIPNRKTRATTIAAQFPNAPLSASCVHAFISYTYLFVQHQKLSQWYTNRKTLVSWSLASRLLCVYQVRSQDKKPRYSAVWCISTTEKGLGNRIVLLLSEHITAPHNKHEWETGKPKYVEISVNLGMRKLALKSICATYSPVTPFFFWFLKSWCQVQLIIRKCNLFKILSD